MREYSIRSFLAIFSFGRSPFSPAQVQPQVFPQLPPSRFSWGCFQVTQPSLKHSILFDEYVINHFQLFGGGIETCKHFSVFEVFLVIFHKHFPCLLVESTFRERDYEEALDDFEDVEERPVGGVPVFLESVDAYFPFFANVWMKYFGDEVALWGIIREIIFDSKLAPEDSSFVGRPEGSLYLRLHISYIGFIEDDFGAYLDRGGLTIWRLFLAFLHLLGEQHDDLWVHLSSILLFFIISV